MTTVLRRRSDDDPIGAYVTALGNALRGPRGARRDVTTELADGLRDAADAYVEAGMPAREAEARAVRESGPVEDVAAEYAPELAAVQGRRTAAVCALSMPATVLAWGLTWSAEVPTGGHRWRLGVLSDLTDWAGIAGGVAGCVLAALLVVSARRVVPVRLLLALLVLLCGGAVLVSTVCAVVMNVANAERIAWMLAGSTPAVALSLATGVVSAWQLGSLCRSANLAFRRG
ncbi:permease prefix domain 1-containing protein [Actinopolymorpha singaporensis]